MPFWNLNYWKYSFPHFSLTCFDILSWNFAYDFFFTVLQIKFECRQFLWELCPFWNLNYWKYSFPHFSLTCFDILSWNFAHDFVLMYYRSSLSVINCVKFCWSYAPFGTQNTGNTQFSALFSYMLWHIDCIWLCFTVLQIKFECHQFASIFVGVMPLLELRILKT